MTFTLGVAALGGPDKQFKTCSSKEPSSSAFPAPPHRVSWLPCRTLWPTTFYPSAFHSCQP